MYTRSPIAAARTGLFDVRCEPVFRRIIVSHSPRAKGAQLLGASLDDKGGRQEGSVCCLDVHASSI